MLEHRHFRHFVALGKELHFGRAAARLNIAQPALTQSIQRLETLLGLSLVERTNRRVVLTEAGQVFLAQAERTLDQASFAMKAAKLAAAGESGELRIGFVTVALFEILPRVLPRFRAQWPDIDLRLDERPMAEQVAALHRGEIDAAFLYAPFAGAQGLEVRTVSRDRFLVAVPRNGALARRKRLHLAELAREKFILFPYKQGPEMYAAILEACRAAGFTPVIAQEAMRIQTMLSLVASGMGITLVQESVRSMQIDGVALVPLADKPDPLVWGLGLVWRPPLIGTALRRFVECVLEAADPVQIVSR